MSKKAVSIEAKMFSFKSIFFNSSTLEPVKTMLDTGSFFKSSFTLSDLLKREEEKTMLFVFSKEGDFE